MLGMVLALNFSVLGSQSLGTISPPLAFTSKNLLLKGLGDDVRCQSRVLHLVADLLLHLKVHIIYLEVVDAHDVIDGIKGCIVIIDTFFLPLNFDFFCCNFQLFGTLFQSLALICSALA